MYYEYQDGWVRLRSRVYRYRYWWAKDVPSYFHVRVPAAMIVGIDGLEFV